MRVCVCSVPLKEEGGWEERVCVCSVPLKEEGGLKGTGDRGVTFQGLNLQTERR